MIDTLKQPNSYRLSMIHIGDGACCRAATHVFTHGRTGARAHTHTSMHTHHTYTHMQQALNGQLQNRREGADALDTLKARQQQLTERHGEGSLGASQVSGRTQRVSIRLACEWRQQGVVVCVEAGTR